MIPCFDRGRNVWPSDVKRFEAKGEDRSGRRSAGTDVFVDNNYADCSTEANYPSALASNSPRPPLSLFSTVSSPLSLANFDVAQPVASASALSPDKPLNYIVT